MEKEAIVNTKNLVTKTPANNAPLARAMILAAGRGERMRPLSDHTPKPLLQAGGKALIIWQIEALARAGFDCIVINVAWHGAQIEAALGDGAQWGVRLVYSHEAPALETAGGIAQALPLLMPGPVLVVSADVWSAYDYAQLLPVMAAMREQPMEQASVHLVMVPNPAYHPEGDFALGADGRLMREGARLTFGNIGIYQTDLFTTMPRGVVQKLTPYYQQWVAERRVNGERFEGAWANIGTPEDLAALNTKLMRS